MILKHADKSTDPQMTTLVCITAEKISLVYTANPVMLSVIKH